MKLFVEPIMSRWAPLAAQSSIRASVSSLSMNGCSSESVRSNLGSVDESRGAIGTGHQVGFAHPGILAKFIAADVYAQRTNRRVINVVVDQDVNDSLAMRVPIRVGDELKIEMLQLRPGITSEATDRTAPGLAGVPTGMQAPVNAAEVVKRLRQFVKKASDTKGTSVAVSLDALIEAWVWADEAVRKRPFASLAEQVNAITTRLMAPQLSAPLINVFASRLLESDTGQGLVVNMLADAVNCMKHYNTAVAANRGTGLTKLGIERDRVEMPVWLLRPNQPRQRVYADIADTVPLLTVSDGTEIDMTKTGAGFSQKLAPRALLLTALMRANYCDLFIHGTGGWAYDRAMEMWWRNWRQGGGDGEAEFVAEGIDGVGAENDRELLAPMTLVSADLPLEFSVPLATQQDLHQAQWLAHSLPHNIDRHMVLSESEQTLVEEKKVLLAEMDADRSRKIKRRQAAFDRLIEINETLVNGHADELAAAKDAVARATLGVANQQMANRRDWPFAIYSEKGLEAMREKFQNGL
jgi:hypothetical protein